MKQRSPKTDVVLLSILLLVLSLPVYRFLPDAGSSLRPSTNAWVVGVVLAVGFGLSVVTVFNVEFRHEALSFSLSEAPLIFAAVFLAPLPGLMARLCGSMVALVLYRKPPAYKLFFNLSAFAVEITLMYVLTRAVFGASEKSDSLLVVGMVGSAVAASMIGSVVVSIAISRFEGDTLRRVIDGIKAGWVLFVNATAAGLLLGLALVEPVLGFLAVIPIAALWLVIRRNGQVAQQLRDLAEIHGFAGRIGQSLDLDEICRAAVAEASRLLRADIAILRVAAPGARPQQFTSGDLPAHVRVTIDDPWWEDLADEPETRLIGPDESQSRASTTEGGSPEIIVSPINDETGRIGTLLLAGPDGAQRHFDEDDVSHLRNLSQQLASSLRKGLLHRQMEYEARHDSLTGLPNRVAFEALLEFALRGFGHHPRKYLLIMDLDRFKEVNDTLGHQAGDNLLIEFSRRVADEMGPGDVCARLAGDEFAILAGCDDEAAAVSLAQRCIDMASRPVVLNGLSIVVTASVGITALWPTDEDSIAPMRRADIAMYNAKSQHVGIELYDESFDRRTPARLAMLGDLRDAIESRQLGISYQPKLDLMTGMIVGVEALVRWTHPERGVVEPADFVRVAEDSGLITQLTDLMLERGIAMASRLRQLGYVLGLSVNLSTHDLVDTQLPTRVSGHLCTYGLAPDVLTLEVTESSLLADGPRARSTINDLDEIGVRLSIDDFGTGYSSLSSIRRLPVRELKIDQSFVTNMLVNAQDMVIVRSTIDLGHNLGLEVVAEGVESEEVLTRLRTFGCDVVQGYWISQPLTAEDLLAWLTTNSYPTRRSDQELLTLLDDGEKTEPTVRPARR